MTALVYIKARITTRNACTQSLRAAGLAVWRTADYRCSPAYAEEATTARAGGACQREQDVGAIEDESEDDYGNADQCPGDVCTLGFTPIVPGLIWEVCTLGPDEARVVCAAALDWAGATDDEIDAAKRVVTIAVLDCPDTTFVGSVCADFVHFQQGNKRIYARFGAVQDRAIDIESPVTIYYGRMSSGFAECMYEETTWEAYCVSRCPWH